MQLVHRASWEEEPGTLRARPRAVQLRWGWHCSELELLAEKVPGGHGWHCVFWLGVPAAGREEQGQGNWCPSSGCKPGTSNLTPATPPTTTPGGPSPRAALTRGHHAGARWTQCMLQAETSVCEEAGAAAAGAVVGGVARPCLFLALPAEDVAVAAALQVVPELRVVAWRTRATRRGAVSAAGLLHKGAWGALGTHQPLPRVCVPPGVSGCLCRSTHGRHQQQGGQRPHQAQQQQARPLQRPHGSCWSRESVAQRGHRILLCLTNMPPPLPSLRLRRDCPIPKPILLPPYMGRERAGPASPRPIGTPPSPDSPPHPPGTIPPHSSVQGWFCEGLHQPGNPGNRPPQHLGQLLTQQPAQAAGVLVDPPTVAAWLQQ